MESIFFTKDRVMSFAPEMHKKYQYNQISLSATR